MNIVALEPFLTELVCALGRTDDLKGSSRRCVLPEAIANLPRVTRVPGAGGDAFPVAPYIAEHLHAEEEVDLDALLGLSPDLVLTSVRGASGEEAGITAKLSELLSSLSGREVKVRSFRPTTLESVFTTVAEVGRVIGAPERGVELSNRMKAQLMDWADNFYDRMKNKRVTFLESVEPLRLAGHWIPDMIRLCSAQSQEPPRGEAGSVVTWAQIVQFRPDVIVVAPAGEGMNETLRWLPRLEQLPGWEDVPAVKRGEVVFAPGESFFYAPGPRLIESMGVLISAVGGLESGYITPRDSFYRLRWLELHRHRLGEGVKKGVQR